MVVILTVKKQQCKVSVLAIYGAQVSMNERGFLSFRIKKLILQQLKRNLSFQGCIIGYHGS